MHKLTLLDCGGDKESIVTYTGVFHNVCVYMSILHSAVCVFERSSVTCRHLETCVWISEVLNSQEMY